ncbi:MAG: rhodanese-like domain-containing protein [Parachlamydiaceae bacterium]|nr:rhodanese-like domain-containing protein [Parachlamydiaceae bacterium]
MLKIMNVDDLKTCLDQDSILLIDVREADEHQTESIEKAVLIPLSEFSVEKVPITDKPIVIHCRSGGRSEHVCQILLKQDPSLDVSNLKGGILAWREAGYPIIKHS